MAGVIGMMPPPSPNGTTSSIPNPYEAGSGSSSGAGARPPSGYYEDEDAYGEFGGSGPAPPPGLESADHRMSIQDDDDYALGGEGGRRVLKVANE